MARFLIGRGSDSKLKTLARRVKLLRPAGLTNRALTLREIYN